MSKFGRKLTKKHKKQEKRELQPKLRAMKEQLLAQNAAMAYHALINTLAEFVQAGGRDAECFAVGAWAYAYLGDFERAGGWVQTTLDFEPQNASARVLLAWLCVVEDREQDACDVLAFLFEHHYAFSEEDAARLEDVFDACSKEQVTQLAAEHPACAAFAGRGRGMADAFSSDQLRMLALLAALRYRVVVGATYPEVLRALSASFHLLDEAAQPLAKAERDVYDEIMKNIRHTLEALPQEVTLEEGREASEAVSQLLDYLMQTIRAVRQRKLLVFLPYKASMWDSFESIWQAAQADDAYETMVIPIPYCDRAPDGTVRAWHVEADRLPKEVPVVDYRQVDLKVLHPDAIFVHNPYDGLNRVTSVDERYYAAELKKATPCLIYVPYYVTAGGMGEFQRSMPSYDKFDYIIAQSEAGMAYFDTGVREKLLPLGSPKLDKVVQLAEHPPEPPAEWKEKMAGRTVYFFNTSIGGFLGNAQRFLQKMRYVFETFRGREDVCLLWRPHPLFEATVYSMEEKYAEEFEELRDGFLKDGLGIYDTTPEIEPTIALSDVYIGDAGTSVTALFGAAGKPLFLFNNRLHEPPSADGWKSVMIGSLDEDLHWLVTPMNQLWENREGQFHFVAQLSDYRSGGYFGWPVERLGKLFICPCNAKEILVFDHGDVRHIALPASEMPYGGRFAGVQADERYLFLLPCRYPYLLRLDLATEEITRVDGVQAHFTECTPQMEWYVGGSLLKDGRLYLASPVTEEVLVLAEDTLERQMLMIGSGTGGANAIAVDGDDLYLLPMHGTAVRCWNPVEGSLRVYQAAVPGFSCKHPGKEVACNRHPFSSVAFTEERILLSPNWGNTFVAIDKKTGVAEPWDVPAPFAAQEPNAYFYAWGQGGFSGCLGGTTYRFMNSRTRRLYRVDVATMEYSEIPLEADLAEVRAHAAGFDRLSEWLQYGCEENALQTLPGLLDGTLPGKPYDAEAERAAYGASAANIGTSGAAIYAWLKQHLGDAEEGKGSI